MSGSSSHYSPDRLHSRRPPPANSQNSTGVYPSHYPSPSIHSTQAQVLNEVTGTSRRSARGGLSNAQNSREHLSPDNHRTTGEFTHQGSRTLQRVNLPNTIKSNPGQTFRPYLAQQPDQPQYPLSPSSAQQPLLPQYLPYSPTTPSQQPLSSLPSTQLSNPYSPRTLREPGMFNRAHNFSVAGNFIDGDVTVNNVNASSSNFMEKLFQEIIQGAAADSAIRDPPPRCQRGTRETILQRCIYFATSSSGARKMRWVVGAAGVGKSAIMQNVAELDLGMLSCVSVFFSANGRNDGTKLVITLAYQLAAKCEPYRRFIEDRLTRDPSLLMSSMSKQFNQLITEPFIHYPPLSSAGRVLIIIDGLDECNSPRTQLEILRLISDLCIMHPSSPVVWFISSRPEPDIVSFFSRHNVMAAYEKEEILVDSDEARRDVAGFLRRELVEIKTTSGSFDLESEWPEDGDFWKLANASSGLFAYADAVVNYIRDPTLGNPASQLSDVLDIIDEHPMHGLPREKHPMALLDVLYGRILSNIPTGVRKTTRKLLLALASNWDQPLFYGRGSFLMLCNWLGVTPNEAYAAINYLRSVLRVPGRDKAHVEKLEPFHKSFIDCISDSSRSHFSHTNTSIQAEARELDIQCTLRIIREAPNGINFGDMDYSSFFGVLARGPGTGGRILLTWKAHKIAGWDDNRTRLIMYQLAIGHIIFGIVNREQRFRDEFYIRLLTAQFKSCTFNFPYDDFRDSAFDESRRPEFMSRGILKRIPLRAINFSRTDEAIKLRFCRPAMITGNQTDPFNSSCKHERQSKMEGRWNQAWTTQFLTVDCDFCAQRFRRHFNSWKTHFPDHVCLVLFSSTGKCCVELKFVDSTNGVRLEWTYWFWCEIPLNLRRKYGSTV